MAVRSGVLSVPSRLPGLSVADRAALDAELRAVLTTLGNGADREGPPPCCQMPSRARQKRTTSSGLRSNFSPATIQLRSGSRIWNSPRLSMS